MTRPRQKADTRKLAASRVNRWISGTMSTTSPMAPGPRMRASRSVVSSSETIGVSASRSTRRGRLACSDGRQNASSALSPHATSARTGTLR